MSACFSEAQLARFMAGELSAGEETSVELHLRECAACRARVSAWHAGEASRLTQAPSTHESPKDHQPADSGDAGPPRPVIEGYKIIAEIHRGGQGIVYKAVQRSTNRMVALKLLPHEDAASDRKKQRFEREVSLAANLRHPNIVTIYDSGLASGRYYFAMEYVHGQPLDVHVRSSDLGVRDKLQLFATICAAVSHAHQHGVVHRDLKPGNILVDAEGQPHVVDFGLAKAAASNLLSAASPLTLTSQFMGTLAYASPEQTHGDPSAVDQRSDVYALGVILFEMLTGVLPYPMTGDLVRAFKTICEQAPPKPSSITRELNSDADTIVLRALAKERERRYQSVAQLQQDVERYLAGEPISARRDSIAYVMRMKGGRIVHRHPVLAAIAIIVASAWVGKNAGEQLFAIWRAPMRFFEQTMLVNLVPPAAVPMDRVRVVSITPKTQSVVGALAVQEKLTDVTPENWKSVRAIHGRLMSRLARAGVAAVAWDIAFKDCDGCDPFNDELVKGVKALQHAGANAVICVSTWDVDEKGRPEMSRAIFDSGVRWGCSMLRVDEQSAWKVPLLVRREGTAPMLSLALAAMAGAHQPAGTLWPTLDEKAQTVRIDYFTEGAMARPGSTTSGKDLVPIAAVRPYDDSAPGSGLRLGDEIGYYVLELPADDVLAKATIPYEDVFATDDDAKLREWFQGRLVLVGDFRPRADGSRDEYRAPDGRFIHGVYAHAIAMDSLLRNAKAVWYPHGVGWNAINVFGAMLGACAALVGVPTRARRNLRLIIAAAVLALLSVLAFRYFRFLCNPLIPALGMLIAFGAAVLILGKVQPLRDAGLSRRSQS